MIETTKITNKSIQELADGCGYEKNAVRNRAK